MNIAVCLSPNIKITDIKYNTSIHQHAESLIRQPNAFHQ